MIRKASRSFYVKKLKKIMTAASRFLRQNWWVAPAMVLIVSSAAAAAILLRPQKTALPASSSDPADICAPADKATFDCYKTELTNIVKNKGPKPAFKLLKASYDSVPLVKSQCHQLAHVVGRTAYTKYGDLSDTFAQGDHFCWAGYFHGSMEELALKKGFDYILNNASGICSKIAAKERYSFYHYNCVHGMGHGFMMVQNDDLFKSLASCDSMTDDWERQSCYGGSFMQNVMEAQNSPDHSSKFLKPNQPMYPCTAVAEKYKFQCYLMQTSYALEVSGYDFAKIFALCEGLTGSDAAYRATCFQSAGRDASGQSASDVERTVATCLQGGSDDAKTNCVIGAVKDFISYFNSDQQAAKLCEALPPELQPICRSTAKDYYSTF